MSRLCLNEQTACLIPVAGSSSASPPAAHTLLMLKSFTAVLTTDYNQLSADFHLPVFGSAGTRGGRRRGNSLINCCSRGVVTSAAVNYCRTQRSNGRFRTVARFSESWRRGMMGIVCADARLSGREVTPGCRRSPHCPSVRGFMSAALCIPNEGGQTLARGGALRHFYP